MIGIACDGDVEYAMRYSGVPFYLVHVNTNVDYE